MNYKLLLIIDEAGNCPYIFINKEYEVLDEFTIGNPSLLKSVENGNIEIVPTIKEIHDYGQIMEASTISGKYILKSWECMSLH